MNDEQKQKLRESVRRSLIDWARAAGEAGDYTDNLPVQRFNPPGHWYEIPNLLRNGVLTKVLEEHPQVETLLLHNVDTLGVNLDSAVLGAHLERRAAEDREAFVEAVAAAMPEPVIDYNRLNIVARRA